MPTPPASEVELLRAAYAAFNARDVDAALALMTADVAWPRAFKGGFVEGRRRFAATGRSSGAKSIRTWSRSPSGRKKTGGFWSRCTRSCAICGTVLADERVGHLFTLEGGSFRAMEVGTLPSSKPLA